MKKYIKVLAAALLAGAGTGVFTACSEDSVYEVNANAVPEAADYVDNVVITVDQETNTAYFEFTGKGVYPVWIIDGKSYSTSMAFNRFYRKAGDYSVEVKIGNGNGVSQGTIVKTFSMEKTKMSGFGGFVYESDFNLWTKATKQINSYYYAPNWAQIADPAVTFDGETFTVPLPSATFDRWQCQMHVGTDICLPAGEHYDGSMIFTSTKDINDIVVKIHPDGDDNDDHSFFMAQKVNLTAGEPVAYFFSDLEAAVDMNNVVYTFDFGGNPDDIEIIIENIVLKKHSDDDGTVVPEISAEPEPTWVAVDSDDNLFKPGYAYTTEFYYAPNWAQIADPGFTDNGDGSYTITLPEATFDRWQAQVKILTNVGTADPSVMYDFCCTVETNQAVTPMFKVTQTGEDNNFYCAEEQAIDGMGKFWRSKLLPSGGAAMPELSIIFDFGGCAAGTEVTVSNIILQVHHD